VDYLSPGKRKKVKTNVNDDEGVKKILVDYSAIILKLKKRGVLRTNRLVSDVGAFFACKMMGFERVNNPIELGYDALDDKGLKYLIKARKLPSGVKPDVFTVFQSQLKSVDFFVYVEFDGMWDMVRILKIPSNKIVPNLYNRVRITNDLVENFSII